jgi:hypothetical protein
LVIGGRKRLFAFDGIGTQLFGGCKTVLAVKPETCEAKYPSADAKVSAAVDKRATEANRKKPRSRPQA